MAFDPFNFMGMMGNGRDISNRDDALRVETDDYMVDTCMCYDTGKWETGILKRDAEWVIVEDYEDSDEAKTGHDKWVEQMKATPNMKLKSIQWGNDE